MHWLALLLPLSVNWVCETAGRRLQKSTNSCRKQVENVHAPRRFGLPVRNSFLHVRKSIPHIHSVAIIFPTSVSTGVSSWRLDSHRLRRAPFGMPSLRWTSAYHPESPNALAKAQSPGSRTRVARDFGPRDLRPMKRALLPVYQCASGSDHLLPLFRS